MMDEKDQHVKLTKREWDTLGSFLLPPTMGGKTRAGPKTGAKLQGLGLIEPHTYVVEPEPGQPAWTRVEINGYRLTQRGHLLYCEWASQQETVDED